MCLIMIVLSVISSIVCELYFLSCCSISVQEGYTAFHLAIDSGHLPIVEYLVGVGADPLIADDVSN